LLAALLTAAVLAWAQDEAPPQPADTHPVALKETVTLPDGSPAADAQVELGVWGKDLLDVTTDAAGRCTAMLPDAGT
jgi:hypothetical protein